MHDYDNFKNISCAPSGHRNHASDRICYIILQERLKEHTYTVTERYYFSLGEKEKDGKNKRLASVEEATLEAVDLLKSALRKTIVTQRTGAYGKSYSAPYRKVVFNDNILYDYFSYICKQAFAKRIELYETDYTYNDMRYRLRTVVGHECLRTG